MKSGRNSREDPFTKGGGAQPKARAAVKRGVVLVLAGGLAACGSGRGSGPHAFVPAATAAVAEDTPVVADTGNRDTTRTAHSVRKGRLPSAPAPRGGMGRGMMGGRGLMGGRGMMGGAWSGGQAPPATAASAADTGSCPQVTQALADAGRQIFGGPGNCATCHGANGQGGPLAPDLADTTWLDADGSYAGIAALIRSGVAQPKKHPAPMPAMGGANLSAGQVCAVAGYVYSLSHHK